MEDNTNYAILNALTPGMCARRSFFQRGGARTKIRGAGRGGAGRRWKSAGRGGAKERVNQLIQKFDNSAYIVMEIFVVYYDVLINENIISSHF